MFFTNRKFKKNSMRLLNICDELIEKYEGNSGVTMSCKRDLLGQISKAVESGREEIATWKDSEVDYIKVAHTMLAQITFDLLKSGKYHLHAGVLNPMSCANNLMNVYKASMRYAVENHFIDANTREEQYKFLLECISQIG